MAEDTTNEEKQKSDEQSTSSQTTAEDLLQKIKEYEVKQQRDNEKITHLTQENEQIKHQLTEQSSMMETFMNTICDLNAQIESLQNSKGSESDLRQQNKTLSDQVKEQQLMMIDFMTKNLAKNKQIQSLNKKIEIMSNENSVTVTEEYDKFVDHLIIGFFREMEQKTNIKIVPKAVMELCSEFYVSLLHSIDLSKGDNNCVIDLFSNVVTTNGSFIDNKCTFCVLLTPYVKNSGVHKFKLKSLITTKKAVSFGIISNKNVTEASIDWLFDLSECGTSYQLYVHHWSPNKVYCFKEGVEEYAEKIENQNYYKKDDEMSMILDCDNWILSFFINATQMGKSIEIEPNIYYPAIAYNVCMADDTCLDQIKIQMLDF